MSDSPVVIDAHHHLWDLQAVRYPWLMETGVRRFFGDPTPIQRDYRVADLRRDMADLPIRGSVHIQVGAAPGDTVTETAWVQSQADQNAGMPQAIVAFCDLASADADQVLDQQLRFANVRGVRQIVGRAPDEDAVTGSDALLDNPQWRQNLGRLPALGLSFDLQLIPPQLPRALQVLKQLPDLNVAICHCASPWDRSADGMAFWRRHIGLLAELPNVHCKLSGFGMFDPQWSSESIRDVVMPVIDAFGPGRCMWGSNFPVDSLAADYQAVFRRVNQLLTGLTEVERAQILARTAARFYSIPAGEL